MSSIKSVSLLSYVGSPTISGDNTLVNKSYVDTKFSTAATTSALGTVKPDGSTITVNNGVISAKISSVSGSFTLTSGALALNAASSTVLGGIKVGARLTMTNGVLSADEQTYTLPTASADTLGGVKVGSGLSISNGVLSYTLPSATTSAKGGVIVGTGLSVSSGIVSLGIASTTALGGIKVGSGLSITDAGVLSNSYTLPTASSSQLGGVKIGSGISISSGVISADYSNLPTASNSAKGGIKIAATNPEFTVTDDVLTLNVANVKTSLGLGTAAYVNTGTASGNVPVLDSNGKLSTGVLPALAITDTFTAANQTAMLALTAQKGDICIRTDENKTYILTADGASTLANWKALATPTDLVTSVAGRTGAVTLTVADIGGTSTAVSSSSTDAQIPTAKAVYRFVTGQGYVTSSGVTGIKINNETELTLSSGVANIPAATDSAYGVVKTTGAYKASDWTASATDVVPSVDSVKDYIATLNIGVASIGGSTGAFTLGDTLAVTTDQVSSGPKLNVVTTSLSPATNTSLGVVKVCGGYTGSDWNLQGTYKNNVPDISAVMGFVAARETAIATAYNAAIAATSSNVEITGDGSKTSFEVTHEFDQTYVMVQVIDETDGSVVLVDIVCEDECTVKINFASAPANGAKYMVLLRK